MFHQTDFGGYLVCCQIDHPQLNGVENNSVAVSLMLSLKNDQIDWTKALYLSFNVFSTKVLIGDTIFYVSCWRRDRHFTWSSESREGPATQSAKAVPSFLSQFKTLSTGLSPGIEPETFRSVVKSSPNELLLPRSNEKILESLCFFSCDVFYRIQKINLNFCEFQQMAKICLKVSKGYVQYICMMCTYDVSTDLFF